MTDTFSITMDPQLRERLDKVVAKKKHGGYRSTAISYYVRQGIELEKLLGNDLENLVDTLRHVELDLAKEVKEGRHGVTAEGVLAYYVRRGIELEKYKKEGLDFMVEFFRMLEEDPTLISKFREFLEQR